MLSLFDTAEKWSAFIEMANHKDAFKHYFFSKPKELLLKYFRENPVNGWVCESDPNDKTAIICYLQEFGKGSLLLKLGWDYEFHLLVANQGEFNTDKIDDLLRSEYSMLLSGFDRVDRSYEKQTKAMEYRNYSLGSIYDTRFIDVEEVEQFAWYAGHKTEELVEQIIEKVERFRKDSEMTRMLRELNTETKINKQVEDV